MVVGVHSLGYCIPLGPNQHNLISFLVQTVSVPVFFFVDGYLFADRHSAAKNISYWEFVRKSCLRLLLPWFIFNLTYTLARYVFEICGLPEEEIVIGRSIAEVAISSYGSVYAPQMYFLLSLFLVRLAFVLSRRLLSLDTNKLLAAFGLFYLIYYHAKPSLTLFLSIPGGQEPLLHAFWGSQFFFGEL